MPAAEIFEHFYISVIGSILGILLGLGVSLAAVYLSQRVNREGKRASVLVLFIPWRSLIVGLILLNLYPLYLVVLLGIHPTVGILSVAYVTFLLTLVVFFHSRQPTSRGPIVRIIPWLRTIVVFSVGLTTHYGSWGGGGLGYRAYHLLASFERGAAWNVFQVICAVALVVDEGTGVIQWLVDSRSREA